MNTPTIPVTVLTGFLGAGKTTLLNRILSEPHGQQFAIIINEFGQAGIDDKLVTAQVDEEIFEMNNGCICCTVRGDLIRILTLLLKKRGKFSHVIIETTGLADPAPVAQTFFADPTLNSAYTLDSIITLADAVHLPQQLATTPETPAQIAFADTIILSKTDAIPAAQLPSLISTIRSLNPHAHLYEAQHAQLSQHGQPIALSKLFNQHAFSLNHALSLNPNFLNADDSHNHTSGISSVSLTSPKALNAGKFDDWISTLLAQQGQNLLRTKGVLNIENEPNRYIFQAVHMMSEGKFSQPWGTETPSSTLVFIGTGLNKTQLREGFLACTIG